MTRNEVIQFHNSWLINDSTLVVENQEPEQQQQNRERIMVVRETRRRGLPTVVSQEWSAAELMSLSRKEKNEEQLSMVEQEMTHILETRLKDKKKAMAIARLVSSKACFNIDAKGLPDPKVALDQCLENILEVLQERCARKRRMEDAKRTACLRAAIGSQQSQEVINVVNEIKLVRLSRTNLPTSEQAAGYTIRPSLPPMEEMPGPVKNVFFTSKLCWYVDSAPLSQLSTANWNELLQEAKSDLQMYFKWIVNHRRTYSPGDVQEEDDVF